MLKNSLAPRRPCKGRGTACGGRVGGEGHEVARGLFSNAFTIKQNGGPRKAGGFVINKMDVALMAGDFF